MKIEYTIKGVTLDDCDLMELHQYYEAACTAEYIMDNYGITDEDKALRLGYEVRRLMNKYGYDEEEAIGNVLENELPTELHVIPTDINEKWDEMNDDDKSDAISDFLSDEYGFCHRGFCYEETDGQVYITNIEWDEEE